jgi:hypothetical protein
MDGDNNGLSHDNADAAYPTVIMTTHAKGTFAPSVISDHKIHAMPIARAAVPKSFNFNVIPLYIYLFFYITLHISYI